MRQKEQMDLFMEEIWEESSLFRDMEKQEEKRETILEQMGDLGNFWMNDPLNNIKQEDKKTPEIFFRQKETVMPLFYPDQTEDKFLFSQNRNGTDEKINMVFNSEKKTDDEIAFLTTATEPKHKKQRDVLSKEGDMAAPELFFEDGKTATLGRKSQTSESIFTEKAGKPARQPLVQTEDGTKRYLEAVIQAGFAGLQEGAGSQQIQIDIGQVRENADVDRIMERLTQKLWESRQKRAYGRRR